MIPKESEAYKYALCMELQQNGFRYAFIEPNSKEVVFYNAIEFETINESELNDLLSEPFFNFDYQSVLVSVSTPRHTIVPNAIFNASTPKEIFELNHQSPIDNLDYRRLPELGLISVYELPLWIKSVFVRRFLKSKINHHSTVLLKGVFSSSNYKPKAYVYKEANLFYLVITDKNKLVYFNLFESSEIADLVYYYLFTLEQKGYDPENVPLNVFGLDKGDADFKSLNDLLTSTLELPKKESQQNLFMLTNQLLCV